MKSDPNALKNALKKREAELQNLMKQMKNDNLQSSTVFRNLQQELENVKSKMTTDPSRD